MNEMEGSGAPGAFGKRWPASAFLRNLFTAQQLRGYLRADVPPGPAPLESL